MYFIVTMLYLLCGFIKTKQKTIYELFTSYLLQSKFCTFVRVHVYDRIREE